MQLGPLRDPILLKMVKLTLRYHHIEITLNTPILTVAETEEQPDVGISDGEPNTYYTLILYDPDAGNPLWLHWVVENLNPSVQDHIIQALVYYGPHPPNKEIHRYLAALYRQKNINQHYFDPKKRPGWTLPEIESKLNLSGKDLVDLIWFHVQGE